jgi:hypothetical protein
MRMSPRITACLIATAFAGVAPAAFESSLPQPASPPTLDVKQQSAACPPRVLAFRSLNAQVDDHVLANLLSDIPMKKSELPLTVVTGEITRCESQTCTVPLMLRASGAEGPVTLAFAVANAKGELSEVHHAQCGSGACGISLVLERGHNTISVGVVDVLSQTTAYTTIHVNATRAIAGRPGKTEWF